MTISSLHLQNFRCYENVQFTFSPAVTQIVGPNGYGKTNVLEAIEVLATGRSFRAERVEDMIFRNWQMQDEEVNDGGQSSEKIPPELARITATVQLDDEDESRQYEMMLTRGLVQGKKTAKKHWLVDGVARRRSSVLNPSFPIVLFLPQDLRIIEGSPSRRREFLDRILCVTHPAYQRSLVQYEAALRRRNAILEGIRDRRFPASALSFWTEQAVQYGASIQQARTVLCEYLRKQYADDCSKRENAHAFGASLIEYKCSPIHKILEDESAQKELASGRTLYGPHKDDVAFFWSPFLHEAVRNAADFGSRGEHRLVMLWMKTQELSFVYLQTKTRPALLLDDVFSELDQEHRHLVVEMMQGQQTILTTTEQLPFIDGECRILREKGKYES
jgi:DNA replication and repair protein RecF